MPAHLQRNINMTPDNTNNILALAFGRAGRRSRAGADRALKTGAE
jgi:hypothetical protein